MVGADALEGQIVFICLGVHGHITPPFSYYRLSYQFHYFPTGESPKGDPGAEHRSLSTIVLARVRQGQFNIEN